MNAILFGKFLASLRSEKKLTQEELAEKLFIDKRKISRWECGMSIPDFETIVKLSEILDVTPYEFSICKRLDKEKLSEKAINKFKNIKDFKKYKLKRKLLIILSLILGIFFILTAIYTFKYYGEVEIYEFKSLDERYILKGYYMHTGAYETFSIDKINFNDNEKTLDNLNNCSYEIYYNDLRILEFIDKNNNDNKQNINKAKLFYYTKTVIGKYLNKELIFKIKCLTNNELFNEHEIKFNFKKKYDNKLF